MLLKEECKAYRNIYIKEWKMRRGVLTKSGWKNVKQKQKTEAESRKTRQNSTGKNAESRLKIKQVRKTLRRRP